MSPLPLRRYRAERMLRRDFRALRASVLGAVRARLGAVGVSLDAHDLDACYSSAWTGLYEVTLAGEEIANPAGWLVLVTQRRALEEHRARRRREAGLALVPAVARDIEEELEQRRRLRQLLEGMRGRLDPREREAASLCYLHGYSRAQAARRMGISEMRMRKLMEGANGRAGVARKVGALVQSIRDEDFCAEQASLMRALAYGLLDPDGERYRLAVMHRGDCPACRGYVASLRGLAAALPPSLFLPLPPLGAGVALAGGRAAASGTAGPASGPAAALAGGTGGGGWIAGSGSLGAKLAVGCVLSVGLGAGCVAAARSRAPRATGRHHPSHDPSPLRLPARRQPVARLGPGRSHAAARAPRSEPERERTGRPRVRPRPCDGSAAAGQRRAAGPGRPRLRAGIARGQHPSPQQRRRCRGRSRVLARLIRAAGRPWSAA